MEEALDTLASQYTHPDAMRLRAFPFPAAVAEFIAAHGHCFVVEQNRDARMRTMLITELEIEPNWLMPVRHYDGTLITARFITATATITNLVHVLATAPRRERISL